MGRPITEEDIEMMETVNIRNVIWYYKIIMVTGCISYITYLISSMEMY